MAGSKTVKLDGLPWLTCFLYEGLEEVPPTVEQGLRLTPETVGAFIGEKLANKQWGLKVCIYPDNWFSAHPMHGTTHTHAIGGTAIYIDNYWLSSTPHEMGHIFDALLGRISMMSPWTDLTYAEFGEDQTNPYKRPLEWFAQIFDQHVGGWSKPPEFYEAVRPKFHAAMGDMIAEPKLFDRTNGWTPWVYDLNADGKIEKKEAVKAALHLFHWGITAGHAAEVVQLMWQTRGY